MAFSDNSFLESWSIPESLPDKKCHVISSPNFYMRPIDGISRKGIGFTRCCGWENCVSLTASNFRCPVSVKGNPAILNICYITCKA